MSRLLFTVFLILGALPLPAQEEAIARYELQDAPIVRDSLAEVMSRPEFARLRRDPPEPEESSESPEWLERFLDWLARILGSTEEESRSPAIQLPGIELVLYVMAALVLIAAIVFILKSVANVRRERQLDAKVAEARIFRAGEAPGETDPQDYWQRAQSLGEQGQFKKAIRELLLGSMSSLERQGRVRHRRGLTNRDYLRATRGVARESLGTIVSIFERVYFGRREATADGFHTCSQEFQKSFLRGAT